MKMVFSSKRKNLGAIRTCWTLLYNALDANVRVRYDTTAMFVLSTITNATFFLAVITPQNILYEGDY
ncbi:hypothetical protein QVD17_37523 [Tagetes erecta]|uniref:Uncharacterized protein n=1 Tax=Tagetes erecta TaxID=13708 RepID=A0AAD8K0P3_TARER|nr:hypothetical protein QVD17_37523 [Tagetes erecta]